ncbi:ATP-dependent Clp protease proteolytic subunit [Desulfonatronum sp. SC1]|uniref:ATP-dependent Clp protease proteolytic subunit n=1 Tax=Desulfonatronum sp. SC1 TaxID=2109626 RepID=UPI001304FAE1|nr:ATP-dependent Clp protease proteolytic subunit [Desulfonatronum sp. SC1]
MYPFPPVSLHDVTCFSQNTASSQGLVPLFTPHDCRIIYSGQVDAYSMKSLIETINLAFGYYQYNQITIDIESPGGEIRALHYLMGQFDFWRAQGRRIATRASISASSAAAAILALGDQGERSVERSTTVLYHFARIFQTNSVLTAEKATDMAQKMNREDERMIDQLLTHIVGPLDDLEAADWHGLAMVRLDWAKSFLARKNDRTHFYFPEAQVRLKSLGKLLTAKGKITLRERVQGYLKNIFLKDEPIDLLEAWCLNLIDEIRDVTPMLVPPKVFQEIGLQPENKGRKALVAGL